MENKQLDKYIQVNYKKIYNFLEKERKYKKIKKTEICQKLNISNSTLTEQFNRLKQGKTITLESLLKICWVLDVSVADLVK
jgi:DNA-binding Xre family transcriptional regulator